MTTDINLLRSQLQSSYKRLIKELEQLKAGASSEVERREGSPFGKREEEATESFELEKRLQLENGLRIHLNAVDHALHKLQEGTYGLCDSCHQPIDPARMQALPHASLCLGCKTLKEKNAKGK